MTARRGNRRPQAVDTVHIKKRLDFDIILFTSLPYDEFRRWNGFSVLSALGSKGDRFPHFHRPAATHPLFFPQNTRIGPARRSTRQTSKSKYHKSCRITGRNGMQCKMKKRACTTTFGHRLLEEPLVTPDCERYLSVEPEDDAKKEFAVPRIWRSRELDPRVSKLVCGLGSFSSGQERFQRERSFSLLPCSPNRWGNIFPKVYSYSKNTSFFER